jgi:hypothetical protein
MKNNFLSAKTLLVMAAVALALTACNKNKTVDETEAVAAQNLNIAEVEDDNLQIMADQAEANDAVSDLRTTPMPAEADANLLNGCATVTKDTASGQHTITIDFGSGCTNAHGTVRKGKIIVTYTGRYRDPGTVVQIVSQDYYVNDKKLDIDRTVTNLGENNSGHLAFQIHATRTVTFSDGGTSSSTIDKTREWIEGAATPHVFSDDVFLINGTGTHTSKRGILYDASTLTPLTRKVACHEFVSGEVKIIRHGRNDRFGILNFGTGECDDEATVTLDNGRSYTIDLRH